MSFKLDDKVMIKNAFFKEGDNTFGYSGIGTVVKEDHKEFPNCCCVQWEEDEQDHWYYFSEIELAEGSISSNTTSGKPKLLILGKKSSGKDTLCEILKTEYGYNFKSSSKAIIEKFFPLIQEVYEWKSVSDAYKFRDEMRPFLYQLIKGYNGREKTRMAELILEGSDVYCGMRDKEEVQACINAGIFDLIIWVDAEKRLGDTEGLDSCNVTKGLADIVIENNGSEGEFKEKVNKLVSMWEKVYV